MQRGNEPRQAAIPVPARDDIGALFEAQAV